VTRRPTPVFESDSASPAPVGRASFVATRTPLVAAVALLVANTLALSVKAWDEHRVQQTEHLTLIARDGVVATQRLKALLEGRSARLSSGDRSVSEGFERPFELDSSGRVRVDLAQDWHEIVRTAARSGERFVAISEDEAVVIGQREGGGYLAAKADLAALGSLLTISGWGAVNVTGAVAPMSAQFRQDPDGRRYSVGCASLETAGLSACTQRVTPVLGISDLSRLAIYLLLAGAPIFGGIGVWSLLRRRENELAAEVQARRENELAAEVQARREAEHRLSLSVDGAGVGVWTYDAQTERVCINEQLGQIMECGGLREMTTREFIERFRPEDRENLANAFRELQRIGSMNITARVGHIDRPTYVDLRGRLSEDMREGSGVAFDVTRQRIAERRAIAAERRLREAIDVFTGPFAEWDSRKRLLHCNRAFGLTFNIPPEALQRGATYESVASRIAKIVRSETPSSTDSRVRETELVDGRWLQIADRPTLDGRLITFGLDITALKRNEEAVMKSERRVRRSAEDLSRAKDRADLLAQMHAEEKRKADAANKAKSVFLANTGHELRTPLVAINGFSEMLTKQIFGPLGNPKYLEYAKDVHAAGTHLLDVINDILDMAKIEAGKMTISRASMDVEDAIDEAVRIMRQKIQDKGLALHINIVPLPEIDGDHRSVRQMMLNLLSNALKFTEQGSITVSARLEGEFIRITVADTGIGIPEEALARLGKPFEQVEEAHRREFKGTGLGLALTRSFAEMHGGRMEIASQLKVGTQMSILLPARLAPVAAATAAE